MKKPSFKRIVLIIWLMLILPVFATWILIAQPGITKNSPSKLTLDSARLKAHVVKLSEGYVPRSYKNTANLDRCAEYIRAHFQKAGADTATQEFTVRGKRYQNVKVKCMIALEMIGYFSSEPGSQLYPIPVLKIFYPGKGNSIAVIGRLDQRKIVRKIKRLMQGATDLPVYSVNAPLLVTGIDYSDHRSYWQHGNDAVMITDTAFYRNLEYHTPNDTAERLNYELMAKTVIQVFEAVKGLAEEELPDARN